MTENQIFPEEILYSTVQYHIVKHSKKTSFLFLVTFIAILIIGISLPFIYIDIYTTSRATILPNEKKLTIYAPSSGKISKYNIDENQKVNKGDTLLIIEHKILKERENLNTIQSNENSQYLSDLKNLVNGNTSNIKSDQYKRELLKFNQEIYNIDVILKTTQSDFERKKHLFNKGVISKSEFENVKLEFDKINNDKENLIKQTRLVWQKEYTQLNQSNISIHSNQKQLKEEENNYIITSPIDGELINMQGFHQGSIIAPGNAIVEISPNKELIVETYINPSDIGFIKNEGKAIYQIDAFNSSQWGFATGKIFEISKDVVIINNTPYYKIKSTINKTSLFLKNGSEGKLKKGMSLTSRFFLTKRTAFQLLFDKVEDWFNPYNNKNE